LLIAKNRLRYVDSTCTAHREKPEQFYPGLLDGFNWYDYIPLPLWQFATILIAESNTNFRFVLHGTVSVNRERDVPPLGHALVGPKTLKADGQMKFTLLVLRVFCVKWLLFVCAAVASAYVAFQATGQHRDLATVSASMESESDQIIFKTVAPPRIQPLVRRLFAADSEEAAVLRSVVQEHSELAPSVSYCCHLLRLYGLKPFRHPVFSSGSEVVSVLTDQARSKEFFGGPIVFRTRSGIRYEASATQKERTGENHRDICLATFAELGLPLSTPVTTEGFSFTLADLLRDSVANFDLEQKELPWTTVAYAIYLRQPQWSNRYGESFTFDDVVDKLMSTRFEAASCGGTHLLYALTALLRTKAPSEGLSKSAHYKLAQYLQRQAVAAIQSQANDGSWDLNWHVAPQDESQHALLPDSTAQANKLLVTGHLLEWLELLPQEMQPPPEVYKKAARWLCRSLASTTDISLSNFCPVVHARLAVQALIDDVRR
jgi:hypothetical protein